MSKLGRRPGARPGPAWGPATHQKPPAWSPAWAGQGAGHRSADRNQQGPRPGARPGPARRPATHPRPPAWSPARSGQEAGHPPEAPGLEPGQGRFGGRPPTRQLRPGARPRPVWGPASLLSDFLPCSFSDNTPFLPFCIFPVDTRDYVKYFQVL